MAHLVVERAGAAFVQLARALQRFDARIAVVAVAVLGAILGRDHPVGVGGKAVEVLDSREALVFGVVNPIGVFDEFLAMPDEGVGVGGLIAWHTAAGRTLYRIQPRQVPAPAGVAKAALGAVGEPYARRHPAGPRGDLEGIVVDHGAGGEADVLVDVGNIGLLQICIGSGGAKFVRPRPGHGHEQAQVSDESPLAPRLWRTAGATRAMARFRRGESNWRLIVHGYSLCSWCW